MLLYICVGMYVNYFSAFIYLCIYVHSHSYMRYMQYIDELVHSHELHACISCARIHHIHAYNNHIHRLCMYVCMHVCMYTSINIVSMCITF